MTHPSGTRARTSLFSGPLASPITGQLARTFARPTVLQVLLNRIDGGLSLPAAVAAPRASQRNTAAVTAEQGFIDALGPVLTPYGYTFAPAGDPGSSAAEIGSVTAIEFGPKGRLTVAAEPVRRGGGHAAVVSKTRR